MQLSAPQIIGSYFREHAHILQQQGIHTNLVEFYYHLERILQFLLIDDGVHRDMHLGSILMGILAKLPDVVQRIAGGRARTETRRTDVHGIRTMVDSSDAALQILGRSQQFQCPDSFLFRVFVFRISFFYLITHKSQTYSMSSIL